MGRSRRIDAGSPPHPGGRVILESGSHRSLLLLPVLSLLLVLVLPGNVRGEVYKWVDENGIAHYTTDRNEIPRHLRGDLPPPELSAAELELQLIPPPRTGRPAAEATPPARAEAPAGIESSESLTDAELLSAIPPPLEPGELDLAAVPPPRRRTETELQAIPTPSATYSTGADLDTIPPPRRHAGGEETSASEQDRDGPAPVDAAPPALTRETEVAAPMAPAAAATATGAVNEAAPAPTQVGPAASAPGPLEPAAAVAATAAAASVFSNPPATSPAPVTSGKVPAAPAEIREAAVDTPASTGPMDDLAVHDPVDRVPDSPAEQWTGSGESGEAVDVMRADDVRSDEEQPVPPVQPVQSSSDVDVIAGTERRTTAVAIATPAAVERVEIPAAPDPSRIAAPVELTQPPPPDPGTLDADSAPYTDEERQLVSQIEADRELLKQLTLDPKAGVALRDPRIREVADRLPKLQAELTALRALRAESKP